MNATSQSSRSVAARVFSILLRGLLPIVIVLAGALGAVRLIQTAPQAKQRPARSSAALVQTRLVAPASEQVVIRAMGAVIAAKEIVLQPQVSGVIRELHPSLMPGGRIRAGERIVTIDPVDYEVAVRQAEATLARAEVQLVSAELELERVEGLQAYEATNKKELDDAQTTKASAAADVAAAQAALEAAKLDLSRTILRAPFSCVVVDETVDVGSLVTSQTELATLVGTDECWVRASIPVDQLHWIQIPLDENGAGSAARVCQRLGSDTMSEWSGRVVRLLGDLEPQGRMARVLVSVPNPLGGAGSGRGRQPLLLGSYVDVAIEGRELQDVVSIGRDELHDGDTVWVMNDEDELEIRTVEIAFRGRDHVLIRGGLESGERLVTSDLPSPVDGMALRLAQPNAGETDLAANASAREGEGGTP